MRRALVLILICLIPLLWVNPARSSFAASAASAAYVRVELGSLGGIGRAIAINHSGQVVGRSRLTSGRTRAFMWEETSGMRDLGTLPGDVASEALDINDAGQVVGVSFAADFSRRAFLWEEGMGMADLGHLDASLPGTAAAAINESGWVAGDSTVEASIGSINRAFLWDSISGMHDLGSLGGTVPFSRARDINDRGQVVGRTSTAPFGIVAFIWDAGTMTDLGGWNADAHGVNEAGQVVGDNQFPDGRYRAVLWDSGAMADLGTLGGVDPYLDEDSQALAINDSGRVVGWSWVPGSDRVHAFIWDSDAGMVDLGEGFATDINDLGQIVGAASGVPLLWKPAGPGELMAQLAEQVERLVALEALNEGQGESLVRKLRAGIRMLETGRPQATLRQMLAFTNQVVSLIDEGVLDPDHGAALLAAANAIIDAILSAD